MAEHPNPLVQAVAEQVAEHMDRILRHFQPGAKITVLVRSPEAPTGDRDFVLSNDQLDLAISALELGMLRVVG